MMYQNFIRIIILQLLTYVFISMLDKESMIPTCHNVYAITDNTWIHIWNGCNNDIRRQDYFRGFLNSQISYGV